MDSSSLCPLQLLSPEEKLTMALDGSTPPGALRRLLVEADTPLRCAIAPHPSLPLSCLRRLLQDRSPEVRGAALTSPQVTREELQKGLQDSSPTVRAALLKRPDLCTAHIDRLLQDPDPRVAREAHRSVSYLARQERQRLAPPPSSPPQGRYAMKEWWRRLQKGRP